MDNKVIEELRDRIAQEPSVLFWGQNYLSSKTGHNLFNDILNYSFCEGKLSDTANFSEILDVISEEGKLERNQVDAIRECLKEIPVQFWIRKIMCMRWGMIMTSAIDSVMCQCVGENFSIREIDMAQNVFKRSDISKNAINISFLYGTIEDDEEGRIDYSSSKLRSLKKRVNNRIDWIYSNILPDYGVFVIDGWNPKDDWVTNLLDNACEMPYNSIYLFGADETILENEIIKSLHDAGILLYDSRSFAAALDNIGFFEDAEEECHQTVGTGKTIRVTQKGKKVELNISTDAIAKLDSCITVLHDEIWVSSNHNAINRETLYAKFQLQHDEPIWNLFSNHFGFYFERTQDEKFLDCVSKELEKTAYKRRYIMLEGNSNTGKTASLANLAYRMKDRVPLIYICGEPTQPDWIERLKKFIKNQFLEKQVTGQWIESILVIWDANTDYNATKRCKNLQDALRECNVVVVGSAYVLRSKGYRNKSYYKDGSGNHHFLLSADLDSKETENLLDSLKSINDNMYNQIKEYARRQKKQEAPVHLLLAMNRIIHINYNEDWRDVFALLQSRFKQETDINEEYAQEEVSRFLNEVDNCENEISKHGAASPWLLKLDAVRNNLLNGEDKNSELDRFERMEVHIQKLNSYLALAGKFLIYLPLTLILRLIGNGDRRILSNEKVFLLKIIENDALIRKVTDAEGYVKISFRHPSEAEFYVNHNFGTYLEERKEKEVALLLDMIRECKWYDEHESIPMLQLVRAFGPNSLGTINCPNSGRHYVEYQDWWKTIADELILVSEENPEVVLVYALFMRNMLNEKAYSRGNSNVEGKPREELEKGFLEIKDKLSSVIESHDRSNKGQYCRLLGEICSNLVYIIKYGDVDESENYFLHLRKYFADAVLNWTDTNSQMLFSRNALLDIWLNGVDNYFEKKLQDRSPMEDLECAEIVAKSISYIGDLLDLSEDEFDDYKLLDKVGEIIKHAGTDCTCEIQEKLQNSNNDTYLYLKAWNCWKLSEEISISGSDEKEYISRIGRNLFYLSDETESNELIVHAKKLAIRAIEVLEEGMKLIDSSKSARCIYMLIRAKWLLYTGHMPLELKQTPCLSLEQWKEFGTLCDKYIVYADRKKEKLRPAPVLINMVYKWCFSNNNEEIEELRARQSLMQTHNWYFERICVCELSTREPKKFLVSLRPKRDMVNKYDAYISSVFEESGKGKRDIIADNLVGKRVYVSDAIAATLTGSTDVQSHYNISKPVVVLFNAKGPQIGLLPMKGVE